MGKTMTVIIETTSLLIVRSGNSRTAWCLVCGAEAQMLEFPTRQLSTVDQLPLHVHRSQAPDGVALICLNSLLAHEQMAKALNGGPQRLPKTEKEGI
jgi:hypothetical protein